MLDTDVKGPPVAGAPLVDSTGSVVAVLVRECRGTGREPSARAEAAPAAVLGLPGGIGAWPAQAPAPLKAVLACTPVVVGAPVSAIRAFLSHTPATAAAPAPWLGIRGEAETAGTVRWGRVV